MGFWGNMISAIAGPYKGGTITRLTKSWVPNTYDGDEADGEARQLLTARIHDLHRNDPIKIAARRTLVDHTVGTGIETFADASVGDVPDDDFCRQSDDGFDYWAEYEADVAGKLSWYDMQRQAASELFDTGETILLRCALPDRDRQVPLCYQLCEAAQLDSSKDQPAGNGNMIRRGIEMNRFNQPVAYWMFDAHPGDPHTYRANESRRIRADRVIHVSLMGRPSQTRNVSLYTTVMQSIHDVDSFLGNEITIGNINSRMGIVHNTDTTGHKMGFSGDGSDNNESDDFGNKTISFGVGTYHRIGKDDKLSMVTGDRPNSQAKPFIDLMLTQIAMGSNLSRYRMLRDYSGITYIAARAARGDDLKAFLPVQMTFGRQFARPVRQAWTREAVAFRVIQSITPTMFANAPRRWNQLVIQPPKPELLDPEKETSAAIARIAAGLSTFRGELGWSWRKTFRQKKVEKEYAEELGIELNLERPSTPQTGSNRQPETEEADA